MPPITRDELVKYIKGLETKVKQFQMVLRKRDAEILRLKNELDTLISDQPADSPAPAPLAQSPRFEPGAKSSSPESQKPAPEPVDTPSFAQVKPSAIKPPIKPLEDRPKTFVKKAELGANERAKEAVRSKETSMEVPKPPENILPMGEEEFIVDDLENNDDSAPKPSSGKQPFVPSVNFKAGEFLSAVLEGEEEADEITSLLERIDHCEPDQRRNILLSLTSVYWRMTTHMAKRMVKENLRWEKRLCMRYGMLDEKLMSERMDIWEQLYLDKSKPDDSGAYYIDEWYEAIARGELRYSMIDEMALDGAKPDPKAVGAQALGYEVLTVPQMQRMCVGPRANMVAVLVQDYCSPSRDNPIINRSWIRKAMAEMLPCDYTMFHRKYRGEDRIVTPLFILCPGYGQRSGCWEPYSPGKKGDTGPRICLCAFPPRSSIKALILGISDYRWEYAKADAMHYWLTEGLTGKWIALFNKKEQRKDLKAWFQECYMHWALNEARRIPKLEKRFREFFWIHIPFGDSVKEKLRGGGMFGRLIEMEEAKKAREEEERKEIERIKAEREARRAKRQSQS